MNYFLLGTVLPPLRIGAVPEILFEDLVTLLKDNLTKKDLEKVEKIRRYIDLKNVKELLRKQPLDPRGNLNEKELDEALVTREGLPEYLYEYLDDHENAGEQVRHFSKVYVTFFNEMAESEKGFLSFYFKFEREWRLLMIGFRSKRMKRDLAAELQYEDFHDPLVAQLIAQKDTPQFEFPFEYTDFEEEVKGAADDPMSQYESVARYRFNQIEEEVQNDPFSVDFALGYFAKLLLVEDWNALSKQQGKQQLSTIVKE